MKIISWNVNGIRAVQRKGFVPWLQQTRPDILCVQETKAQPQQLEAELLQMEGYHAYWASAQRKGYSGTLIYTRIQPQEVSLLGIAKFDDEGRVLVARYASFTLVNCYFPNSQPERARIDYKLDFNRTIQSFIERLGERGERVVICGDFNVAHRPIDLARPEDNENSPGYLPEERAWMEQFLQAGYLDTFRCFCQEPGHYSWWSYRAGARARNVGWRIDYFCVPKAMRNLLQGAGILPAVSGSDHCPVFVELDLGGEEGE